jgi:hypothetical protein
VASLNGRLERLESEFDGLDLFDGMEGPALMTGGLFTRETDVPDGVRRARVFITLVMAPKLLDSAARPGGEQFVERAEKIRGALGLPVGPAGRSRDAPRGRPGVRGRRGAHPARADV